MGPVFIKTADFISLCHNVQKREPSVNTLDIAMQLIIRTSEAVKVYSFTLYSFSKQNLKQNVSI
jgi:hypothetical protein